MAGLFLRGWNQLSDRVGLSRSVDAPSWDVIATLRLIFLVSDIASIPNTLTMSEVGAKWMLAILRNVVFRSVPPPDSVNVFPWLTLRSRLFTAGSGFPL
ncbi:MAG: hypothetical protein JRN17_03790 [Nitrososphaerota archaeon]|nr:hypothetical protein [Nitrososphaerota archaeon]